MRPLPIVGVVLILLGGFVLVRGLSYTSKHDVLKVGSVEASVSEKRAVPAWAGGAAVVVGLVLVVAAASSRRR
jgi:hypothetical protein